MKKLIFIFAFALLGTYFQSAQAQTFSRVVTVNRYLDTLINGSPPPQVILSSSFTTLYTVPVGKVFKLEFFSGNYYSSYFTGASYQYPVYCQINDFKIVSYKNNYPQPDPRNYINFYNPSFLNEPIWLKSGDVISIPSAGYNGNNIGISCFLSGIEYDAQ